MTSFSVEFKRAIAAAAISRLADGPHSVEAAARLVAKRLGDIVYPSIKRNAKAKSLVEYRERILALDPQKSSPEKLAIGRYHYDSCLKWVEDAGIPPEASADILIETLTNELAGNTNKR